jgi:hypothetical protein
MSQRAVSKIWVAHLSFVDTLIARATFVGEKYAS